VRSACVYEARNRHGLLSATAPVEAYCRTHGFDTRLCVASPFERYAALLDSVKARLFASASAATSLYWARHYVRLYLLCWNSAQ
jgi:hypothetical protein